jgi:CxxC motif-containing protein (DUF1111 family)
MSRPRLPALSPWVAVALFTTGLALRCPVGATGAQAPAGGAATVVDEGPTAFGRTLANLDPLRWDDFRAGKRRFVRAWPHRGPWSDAASCADCHFRDGRGPRPGDAQSGRSHLLRLGRHASEGDPVYGAQLRRIGVAVPAPGQFAVQWTESGGHYRSGEPYLRRRPIVSVSHLSYGALDRQTRMSLRVPPAVFGLGLLEAVPEQDVLARADPDDADRDGVSGRAQWVRDPSSGRTVLGRFGWKASRSSLAAQAAAALLNDLGVTSPLFPVPVQPRGHDGDAQHPEIGDSDLASVVLYLRALAVPARRRAMEPVVREGEALFTSIGCAACHRPRLETGPADWPELANQTIGAYTDLLLHDLGPDLADEVEEGVASGREWRTPPLWGLGLLQTVNGAVGLLHDGRARSAEEAILWHGGEAEAVRQRFIALPRTGREALLQFLDSL